MATINIGTNKGNIAGVKTKKPFHAIVFADIVKIVHEKYGEGPIQIFGWGRTHPKRTKKPTNK